MRLTDTQREQVELHLGLARSCAARAAHGRRWVAGEDLFGAAFLGLCLAAAHFNPALGVPFSAYAILRIKGEVGAALRSQRPLGFRESARLSCAPNIVALTHTHAASDPASRPEADLEWADLFEWWFKQLTPDQALVIQGIYWDGLPIRASKHWAGMPYWYARKLHAEAIERLRREVA